MPLETQSDVLDDLNGSNSTKNSETSSSQLVKKQPKISKKNNVLALEMANDQSILPIENEKDFLCGIFRWHPKFMQRFANKQCFLALFCLTSVLQGVYYTYFVSMLTTIEKLYQIPSKTTGIIMSSTEIGQISGALLLTYYGGQGHRPRWIATGMLVFSFSVLLCSTPHYLFGSHSTQSFFGESTPINHMSSLCVPNSTLDTMCHQGSEIVIKRSRVTNSVLGIFFMSLLMIGLGTTAVNTLGIPYIDDNVAPKESPLYFGITIGVRIFGPVCGFLLGSICTSIPVQFPFGSSDLSPADPNWIGAWWLGLFLVGISLALVSIPMMVFPRQLLSPDPSSYCHKQQQQSLLEQEKLIEEFSCQFQKNSETKEQSVVAATNHETKSPRSNLETSDKELSKKEIQKIIKQDNKKKKSSSFSSTLKRLLSNDILLCRTASSVLHILPISGLYTFLPKYLESQFQLRATYANMIAGLAGILVMGFGVFSSGTLMRKFNPSARFVAKWIAFAAFSYVLGMIILMFLGCPTNRIAGFEESVSNRDQFGSNGKSLFECSSQCQCSLGRFEPICLPDGVTYVSPCLAGCTTIDIKNIGNATEKSYVDCSCSTNTIAEAIPGLCSLQCNTLPLYIIIFSLTVLIHSTSEVGSMLLTLRCVEPQDKAMALGFLSFATSLFGNVPCPILYGAIVDSTCLFWEEDCGKRGACRLYDSNRFRQLFHGLTAFIMFLAFCIDIVVCYKASKIQFHENDQQQKIHDDVEQTYKISDEKFDDSESDDSKEIEKRNQIV